MPDVDEGPQEPDGRRPSAADFSSWFWRDGLPGVTCIALPRGKAPFQACDYWTGVMMITTGPFAQ